MFQLSASTHLFPSPQLAHLEPNGLLAFGGDLSVPRLVAAYQQGIFPWYSDNDPILWWSPNPRTIIRPTSLHVSRSMRRFLKNCPYTVTLNHSFKQVIEACAGVHKNAGNGVWIHPEMIAAYIELHQQGHAQSVEVWHHGELVGGMYGVATNHVFCGESMFHTATNASKTALITLAQHFFAAGGRCIDTQIANDHTVSMGAIEISRTEYLRELNDQSSHLCPEFWTPRPLKTGINE